MFRCRMLKNNEIEEHIYKTLDIQSGEEIFKSILLRDLEDHFCMLQVFPLTLM